ncbi:translocation/assembly module TamB domain-containing protein [Alteromonadaceae bacterium BrNp21-10]|nr:translocation/assembly module TamB domain-containing protein [Alteromonadaceae bacterium BrNp21-10]
MKWLKRLGLVLATIIVLLLFLVSPWGTRSLLFIAASYVPELEIEYDSGSLVTGMQLSSISWNGVNASTDQSDEKPQPLSAEIQQATIQLNWSCVFIFKLCLTDLDAQNIVVNLPAASDVAEVNDEAVGQITLPFPLSVSSLNFKRVQIKQHDAFDVVVSDIATDFSFFRTLRVKHLNVKGVAVTLPPVAAVSGSAEPFNPAMIANWQYTPPALKLADFPIRVSAPQIALKRLHVQQGDEELLLIEDFTTDIALAPKKLTVNQLALRHQLASLTLQGFLAPSLQHQFKGELITNAAAKDSISLDINNLIFESAGTPEKLLVTAKTTGNTHIQAKVEGNIVSDQLPLSLNLSWQNLSGKLADKNWSSKSGKVTLNGDMQQRQLQLATDVDVVDLPAVQLEVKAQGNQRQVNVELLNANSAAGNLSLTGALTVAKQLQWQGLLQAQKFDPLLIWPQLSALVNGQLQHSIVYDTEKLVIDVSDMQADGNWQGYVLKAAAKGHYDSLTGLDVPELSLSTGDNHISGTAAFDAQQKLAADLQINAENITQLHPDLEGNAQLQVKLGGSLDKPTATILGGGGDLQIADISIQRFAVEGKLHDDVEQSVDLNASIEQIRTGQQLIDSVELQLEGHRQQHQLDIRLNTEFATLISKFSGELQEQRWQGQWLSGKVVLPQLNPAGGQQDDNDQGTFVMNKSGAALTVDWQQQQYRLAKHCWQNSSTAPASLCINTAKVDLNDMALDITASDLPFLPLLQTHVAQFRQIQSDASLSLTLAAQWDGKNLPQGQVKLDISPAKWTFLKDNTAVDIQTLSANINAEDQSIHTRLSLQSPQIGQLLAKVTIDQPAGAALSNSNQDYPIKGQLQLQQLHLQSFEALALPLSELQGQINAQVQISGSLQSPHLSGDVDLKDGIIDGPMLPSRISQLQQHLRFEGQVAQVDGQFLLGQGKGQVQGNVGWQDHFSADLKVKGEHMEIDYQNIVRAKISPDIRIQYLPTALTIGGEVTLPYARVKVRELPPEALSPSDDVVLVGQEDFQQEAKTALNLDIKLKLDPARANNVKIEALGLKSDIHGQLILNMNNAHLAAHGELKLANGRYQAYGQDLQIRKGEISFSGPADTPFLNIDAIREPTRTADNVIAGIRVEGDAQQPKVSVFSEPAMDQPQALSYLLRGQNLNQSGETSGDAMLANALIGFGLSKSGDNITHIGRKLGVEDLTLDTSGQGDGTKLSVSGYIAPGVQIRYGVGVFDSASEVALRYQLLPKLYIEAVSGLNNALDLYYQFSFYDDKEAEQD